MNEYSTHTEKLIQYLDGELPAEELESLKKNLSDNQALREELDNLRLARDAARRYGLKSKIRDIHKEMMPELKQDKPPKSTVVKMFAQTGLRAAAVLIVLVGLSALYQYYTASPEKLFSESYQPFDIHEMRGTPEDSRLLGNYKHGNMDSVIMEFNSLRIPEPEDYILAGIAFLESNKPDKAIQTFNKLIQQNAISKTDYFEDDAEYYLAMSYLKNREPEKALPILEKIQADPAHPYNSKLSKWFILKAKRLH